MTEMLETIITNAQTKTGGVFILSFVVLAMGIPMLARLGNNSPFVVLAMGVPMLARLGNNSPLAGSALQVLPIVLLVPAAMFLGVTDTINAEAVTSLLGGIVGYAFGRTTGAARPPQ
jgi:presenilin-like A22 family membrane protease